MERLLRAAAAGRWHVDPEQTPYRLWVAGLCVLAGFSACTASYAIAFDDTFARFHGYLVAEWLIDVLFVADLCVVRRRIGHSDGSRSWRWRQHVRSVPGVADIVACLPVDVVQLWIGWSPWVRVNKMCRLVSLMASLRNLNYTMMRWHDDLRRGRCS